MKYEGPISLTNQKIWPMHVKVFADKLKDTQTNGEKAKKLYAPDLLMRGA